MKSETLDLQQLSRIYASKNQTDLAKHLGISQSMISLLLREKVNMHGSTKLLISKLLEESNT